MLDQRNLHVYLNWARERIDKTDATLASFETKASEAKADLKPKFGDLVYFESCHLRVDLSYLLYPRSSARQVSANSRRISDFSSTVGRFLRSNCGA